MGRTVPMPEHGTPARYRGTPTGSRPPCKCRKCIDAHTKACALRDAARLGGIAHRIPTEPVAVHVHALMNAGMSRTQIAIAAGVSRTSVCNAASRKNPSFNRGIGQKILAVRPRTVRPTDRVPAHGTKRRLQALYAIGHGAQSISAATGLTDSGVQHILYSGAPVVTASTYAVVKAAYRQLMVAPGTSVKARASARRHGWLPPLAWGDIDDPNARPEIDEHADKRGRPAKVDEARVARLTREGLSAEQIARELGCHERTVIRARGRARDMAIAA